MKCLNPLWLGENAFRCGKCYSCRVIRMYEWITRLEHELETTMYGVFATLTYEEEHIPKDRNLSKRTLQLFFKRLRRILEYYHNNEHISYYAIGDYGDLEGRPHYHCLIFGISKSHPVFTYSDYQKGYATCKAWLNGFVHVLPMTDFRIKYVTSYITKKHTWRDKLKMFGVTVEPFSLMSKGIGKQYCLDHKESLTKDMQIYRQGAPRMLPRYYRKLLEIENEELKERFTEQALKGRKEQFIIDRLQNDFDPAKMEESRSLQAKQEYKNDLKSDVKIYQ